MRVAKAPPKPAPPQKPIRICARSGCTTPVYRTAKFCSKVHRAEARRSGEIVLPPQFRTKWSPEYLFRGKTWNAYFEEVARLDDPKMVPTESSFVVLPKGKIPTKEGYAVFIGVPPQRLDAWALEHPGFAETLDILAAIQKDLLMGAAAGRYPPGVATRILAVNHGMVESKEDPGKNARELLYGLVKSIYDRADELSEERRAKKVPHRQLNLPPHADA